VTEAARSVTRSDAGGPQPGRDDVRFGELYRTHRDGLVRLAYLLTGSQAAAEDLVQDVFMRCRDRLDDIEQPLAYLRRGVTNACYSWHRRRKREAEHIAEGPAVVSGTYDIEMWDALSRLTPRRRRVLVLRFYMDLPEAEVASMLGWRVGTVKSTTHRALQDLRRMLEP
jgi:RNA polymerase sigma-70 factor (sigma-E family)